jgi:hypothetical protein
MMRSGSSVRKADGGSSVSAPLCMPTGGGPPGMRSRALNAVDADMPLDRDGAARQRTVAANLEQVSDGVDAIHSLFADVGEEEQPDIRLLEHPRSEADHVAPPRRGPSRPWRPRRRSRPRGGVCAGRVRRSATSDGGGASVDRFAAIWAGFASATRSIGLKFCAHRPIPSRNALPRVAAACRSTRLLLCRSRRSASGSSIASVRDPNDSLASMDLGPMGHSDARRNPAWDCRKCGSG